MVLNKKYQKGPRRIGYANQKYFFFKKSSFMYTSSCYAFKCLDLDYLTIDKLFTVQQIDKHTWSVFSILFACPVGPATLI